MQKSHSFPFSNYKIFQNFAFHTILLGQCYPLAYITYTLPLNTFSSILFKNCVRCWSRKKKVMWSHNKLVSIICWFSKSSHSHCFARDLQLVQAQEIPIRSRQKKKKKLNALHVAIKERKQTISICKKQAT